MVKQALPLEIIMADGKKVIDVLVNESRTHFLFEKIGKTDRKNVKTMKPLGKTIIKVNPKENEKPAQKPTSSNSSRKGNK